MRILVADDERVLANTVATALRAALDAEVDVAFDGITAQHLARKHQYSLALIDFCLPPPTGLELLASWQDEGLTHPVLMMSGGHAASRRTDALAAGATGYLEKPFPLAELIDEVRSSLGTP